MEPKTLRVRLSAEQAKRLALLQQDGETASDVVRRLINLAWQARQASG